MMIFFSAYRGGFKLKALTRNRRNAYSDAYSEGYHDACIEAHSEVSSSQVFFSRSCFLPQSRIFFSSWPRFARLLLIATAKKGSKLSYLLIAQRTSCARTYLQPPASDTLRRRVTWLIFAMPCVPFVALAWPDANRSSFYLPSKWSSLSILISSSPLWHQNKFFVLARRREILTLSF